MVDQVFFILLVVVGLNQWVNSQSSDPHSNLPLQCHIIYFLFLDLKVQSKRGGEVLHFLLTAGWVFAGKAIGDVAELEDGKSHGHHR